MVIAQRVNGEAVVVLGWGRAILMQVAHPLVAAAIAQHSDFEAGAVAYVRRMRRTIAAMLSLTFGTEPEVRRAAAQINAIHARVHGRLPETVGPFCAGTRYSPRPTPLCSRGCTRRLSIASCGPTGCLWAR